MNRRDFICRTFGAVAAARVAPLVPVGQPMRAFTIDGAPLTELAQWNMILEEIWLPQILKELYAPNPLYEMLRKETR